jgi:hypothetical protein
LGDEAPVRAAVALSLDPAAGRVAEHAPELNEISDRLSEEVAGLQELVAAQLDAVAASTYPRSTQGST